MNGGAPAGGDNPPAASQPRPFLLARNVGARAEAINALYNEYTGAARSLAEYRWQWEEGPVGRALSWAIVETATGAVVGHHGIVLVPLVERGERWRGGRTENTILLPRVRTKVFYAGMEKKALAEAREQCDFLYTVFSSGAHARVRTRLGYRHVGRWVGFVVRTGPRHLESILRELGARLLLAVPAIVLRVVASAAGTLLRLGAALSRGSSLQVEEVSDLEELGGEYAAFWEEACRRYDLTIDRSLAFLRWRVTHNPYVRYRIWVAREAGRLWGVFIGHRSPVGAAPVLEIDDLILAEYDSRAFIRAVRLARRLDRSAAAVVIYTVESRTPLYEALRRCFPVQSRLWRRYGGRLWDDFMALDDDERRRWYVTALFTEGTGDSITSGGL